MGVSQSSGFESNLAILLDMEAPMGTGASVCSFRASRVGCRVSGTERRQQGVDISIDWFLRFEHLWGYNFTNHVGPYPGSGSYVFPSGTVPPWTPACHSLHGNLNLYNILRSPRGGTPFSIDYQGSVS